MRKRLFFVVAVLLFVLLSLPCYADDTVESTPTPSVGKEVESTPAPDIFIDETATPTPTPTAGEVPVITKHPVSETVAAGGSCKFTVKATGYDWISWYFVGKDGSTITYADKAASVYNGLSVSGANSNILSLTSIPSAMNGLRVGCVMGNTAGKSSTQTCYLIVTGTDPVKTTPTQIPTYTPAPSGVPISGTGAYSDTALPTATSVPTPVPTIAPTPTPTPTPVPTPVPVKAAEDTKPDHTVAILITIIVLVLIICGTVIVLVSLKTGRSVKETVPLKFKSKEEFQDQKYQEKPNYRGKH